MLGKLVISQMAGNCRYWRDQDITTGECIAQKRGGTATNESVKDGSSVGI